MGMRKKFHVKFLAWLCTKPHSTLFGLCRYWLAMCTMLRMMLPAVWPVIDIVIHIHRFVSTLTVPSLCYPNYHINSCSTLAHKSSSLGYKHTQTKHRQHKFMSETLHRDASKAEMKDSAF